MPICHSDSAHPSPHTHTFLICCRKGTGNSNDTGIPHASYYRLENQLGYLFLLLNPRPFQKGLFSSRIMPAMRSYDLSFLPKKQLPNPALFPGTVQIPHTFDYRTYPRHIVKKRELLHHPKIPLCIVQCCVFPNVCGQYPSSQVCFCNFFFLPYIAGSLNNQQVVKQSHLLHLSHPEYVYEESQKCDNSFWSLTLFKSQL